MDLAEDVAVGADNAAIEAESEAVEREGVAEVSVKPNPGEDEREVCEKRALAETNALARRLA